MMILLRAPYGLRSQKNSFHFNSKGDQSLFGTPYIDYGARQYNPSIANVFVKSDNYLIEPIYCSI